MTATSLTRTSGSWQPGALKGLKVNPDSTRGEAFTIVDNTATTLFTDPADGDLTQTAAVGSQYAGVFVANDEVMITGKAWVYSADPLLLNRKLTITGGGSLSADPLTVTAGNELVVDGGTLYGDAKGITADTVTVKNGGLITCLDATTTVTHKLVMDVATMTIDAASKIDVSRKGYLGGWQGSSGSATGRTIGNTTTGGSTSPNGGSYGGLGGIYGGSVNVTYGDYLDPNDVGSGGGAYNYANNGYYGGNGGGLLRITAGSIALAGSILADGGNSTTYNDGGGSGGGIRIDVGALSGTGSINAKGGSAGNWGGSGGGGRIAVYYDALSFPSTKITAAGGTGGAYGMAGTVHLHQQ